MCKNIEEGGGRGAVPGEPGASGVTIEEDTCGGGVVEVEEVPNAVFFDREEFVGEKGLP